MSLEVNELNVLYDNVLVSGIKPETRDGIIRGVTSDDKPEMGRVLRVGPGRVTEDGTRLEMSVRPGMLVLFNQHTTTKFNIEGRDFFVLREEDIIGFQ
mgnify:CR=1 FL=1